MKEGGILKSSKEENTFKEKQRSNSKVSFLLNENLEKNEDLNLKKKSIKEVQDQEMKENQKDLQKNPADMKINEEM